MAIRVPVSDGTFVLVEQFADVGSKRLILLHGLSQQRRFWLPVVRDLAEDPDLQIAAMDQRGHGDTDTPVDADYSIARCAEDVLASMDALGWPDAVIAGHSWGASVALAVAGSGRARSVVLVDGGLRALAALGPREEVRRRLTPPALGVPEDELWRMIASGPVGPYLDDAAREALRPTFVRGDDGMLRTRIGVERHLRVLDGLLDYDPRVDLAAISVPLWALVCGEAPAEASLVAEHPNARLLVWQDAIHDVPLQWPHLVAGLLRTAVDEAERTG